jgi:hypothetical protein
MKDGLRSATHRAGQWTRFTGLPGTLSTAGALMRQPGGESMSDDPDFPKANHALQVVRQARLSRKALPRLPFGRPRLERRKAG